MTLDPLQLGILLIVGIVAGFINVMAGGGTLLVLPIMVFMGIPGNVANGTNRIAMLAQNITAVTTFYKKGVSNFRLSFILGLCSLPGAIVGAYLGAQLEGKSFNVLLAVVMIIVMVVMLLPQKKASSASQLSDKAPAETSQLSQKRFILGHVLMVFVGFWGGFIMAGVGLLMLAVLNKVMGIDLVASNAHKVFIEIIFTIFALAIFASQLQLLWAAGLFLALGNSIGGWFAANYQVEKGAAVVKKVLFIVLTVFIIKLVFFSS